MEPITNAGLGPKVHTVYERSTATWQYLIADPSSRKAIIIDPTLDSSSRISTTAADSILNLVRINGYCVERILETHATSTSRSSAWYLRTQLHEKTGLAPRISIGKSLAGVQRLFARKYGIQDAGWDFDRDFADGEVFSVGNIQAQALNLPGHHSPDHLGFLLGGNVFVGDPSLTVIQDLAQSNFEDEATHKRWTSIQRLLGMPATVRIYTSHGNTTLTGEGRPFETVEDLRARCKQLVQD